MGSFDGCEVCELVGLYMLDGLSSICDKEDAGLYRDDGLAAFENLSGPEATRMAKKIIKLFKDNNLGITIETNLKKTDFLDVTLDLESGKFLPYRKPNDLPVYVSAYSNHPPSTRKQLPDMINRRISDISCDAEEFEKAKPMYEDALKKSGYTTNLKYEPTTQKRNNRKRKTIWFNPPYSENVKTNIGKEFLRILQRNFHPSHKFRKLFNKSNVKVSYSCLPNMENIIKKHNARVINSEKRTEGRSCNCTNKSNCPLDGECCKSCIIYKAEVTSGQDTKIYYGAAETEFKTRYNNHNCDFRHEKNEKKTELSKHIWDLKKQKRQYSIKWSIAARASPYKCGSRRCDLCLTEKLTIALAEKDSLLNHRSEIISKCRHTNKFRLKNFKVP